MNLELDCKKDVKEECTANTTVTSALHEDAYANKSAAFPESKITANILPGTDVLAQEGLIIANILDSGNAQIAYARLQNDLIQLRPNRYAQNLLLNDVNLYDHKGLGSDLNLGYYNPYSQSYSYGYIIPSVFRPFPTYPLSY